MAKSKGYFICQCCCTHALVRKTYITKHGLLRCEECGEVMLPMKLIGMTLLVLAVSGYFPYA